MRLLWCALALALAACTSAPAAKSPSTQVAAAPSSAAKAFDPHAFTLALQPVARGFRQPLAAVHAGDGSGWLFAVEKGGAIRIVKGGSVLPAAFLDITPLVKSSGSEQGLLGLAFHPKYRENGQFYVNYSDVNGDTAVARYRVSGDPDRADGGSASMILQVKQPYANHNGGNLVFGPDGYLWIGLGDGGSGGDPHGNGQSGQTLLGKLLRIDVDSGQPYGIPPDNPFVKREGFRPEIWAIGLRNPWRYSFDRMTKELYIADVGQNEIEEIDVEPPGAGGRNYGWNILEGSRCFKAPNCDKAGLTLPVTEYDHSQGCSITGGHVYRGSQQPALVGAYFYGDYCSGRIWSLARNGERWVSTELLHEQIQISSFGEDEAGEVYLTGFSDGVLYRLTTR